MSGFSKAKYHIEALDRHLFRFAIQRLDIANTPFVSALNDYHPITLDDVVIPYPLLPGDLISSDASRVKRAVGIFLFTDVPSGS